VETATKGGKKADHFKTTRTPGLDLSPILLARIDEAIEQ